MTRSFLRWMISLVALLAVGPLTGTLIDLSRAPDGGPGHSALVCETPAFGAAMTAAALLGALAVAVVASRVLGSAMGMAVAGMALVWPAWRTGTVEDILGRADDDGPLMVLCVEAAVLLLACAAAGAFVLLQPARTQANTLELLPERPDSFARATLAPLARPMTWVVVVVVAGGALLGAWLIGQSSTKGQLLAAAIGAGVLGGALGRLVAALDHDRVPTNIYFLGMALAALVAPLAAGAMVEGELADATRRGQVFGPAMIMPLDWVVGAFLGIPWGLRWVGASFEKHAKDHQAEYPARTSG